MLKTSSVYFKFSKESSFHFPDIELADGHHLLILGKSGIGKTTLLHLLAGLLSPKSGTIELNGRVLSQMSASAKDKFRGRNIGIVFQRPHFVQSLSLENNLALVQYLGGHKPDKMAIMGLLENLEIKEKLNSRPNRLSQGEQQRAAIALALINSPKLILADEPTSSLDDENCQRVINLLISQAEATHANLVIITHDQRLKDVFQNVIEL